MGEAVKPGTKQLLTSLFYLSSNFIGPAAYYALQPNSGGPMDHSSHKPLQAGEIIAANVKGANIYGRDDKMIGNVSEMLGAGQYARAVIEVGGFFGIGVKQVDLDVSRIDFTRDENGKVLAHTKMTKVELKNLPEHRG
jgi:hypothetical protein